MRSALFAIGCATALVSAGSAAASEYCVICSAPEARYRCMTNDGRQGAGTDQRAWLQCIQQLAKTGGHESCTIDRTTVAPCLGSVQPVDVGDSGLGVDVPVSPPNAQGPATAAPAPSATPAVPPGEPAAQPPVAAEPAAEPGFLDKSKQNLENAGSAIGNAAQKSWDCMSSLFKKC